MGSAVDGNIANAQLGFYVALSYNGTRMLLGCLKLAKGMWVCTISSTASGS